MKTTTGADALTTAKALMCRAWSFLRDRAARLAHFAGSLLARHQDRMRTDGEYRRIVKKGLASGVQALNSALKSGWVGVVALVATEIYIHLSAEGGTA